MEENHQVIIIGGGLSGLATAHFLRKQQPDLDLLLLEAGNRPGGAIRSFSEEGFLAEWGPHGFLDNIPESRELLADTGLDQQAQRAPLKKFLRYVCHQGHLVALPQSPKQLITTPLLSPTGKLRLLGDLWIKPILTEQSLGEWAAHRFGHEVLPLVDAAATGTFAGDYQRLSIDAVMPGVRKLEKDYGSILRGLRAKKKNAKDKKTGQMPSMLSFPEGMEHLVATLAANNPLRTNTRVNAISRSDSQWRLETAEVTYTTPTLIVALPVNAALPLLTPLSAPPVPEVPEARINNVLLGFTDRVKIPYGFGYLAPERENRFALGAMFSTHMFPGRAPQGKVLIEVLVGGRRHPERLDLHDDELLANILTDLGELLPLTEPPCFSKVLRPAGGIPQMEVGNHQQLTAWRHQCEQTYPGLHLCGFGWDGIGMNDMIKSAKQIALAAGAGVGKTQEEAPVKPVYF
ncbi:MAG: protoporphyrinogen oxidase [Desulfobulbaceae bacterium]|nr:protoporphyrinogen oxidase [Desulfobulbaceae bacterium]